uniref:hypothetical protein n=1 Tax=Stenotrophomonas maltophilia TaxID=40324 RepID=UPI0039C3AF39
MKHLIQRPASRRRCTLASSITHILTGGTLLLVGAVAPTSAFAQEKATNLDLDRPAFRRHPVAIIHGNDRGVYGQQQ